MAINEVMDGVNYNEKIINMEKLTEHFQFTTKNKQSELIQKHEVKENDIYTAGSDSSDEGIPIPEELSVSQIPHQRQSEIMN